MPAASPAPQLTARAIVLAILLAVLMGAANTYLGLFAGMTIASAIPSAVVSMAVLKLLGRGGILENNIVQTGGSRRLLRPPPDHLHAAGAGDARRLARLTTTGWVFAFAALGGVLGVLFSVPLRRALIVDQKLAFPGRLRRRRGAARRRRPARTAPSCCRWRRAAGALVKLCGRQRPAADPRYRGVRRATSAAASRMSAPTCRRRCSVSATSAARTSAS